MESKIKKIKYQLLSDIVRNLKIKKQRTVLVGGVFDILHYGHVRFLEEAKKHGDILIVAVEPDIKVKKTKGQGRPINNETIRTHMLTALTTVDYVLILPLMNTDNDYQDMVKTISPRVIAVTAGDPRTQKKQEQAKSVGAEFIIIPRIPTISTTQLANLLALE